MSDDFYNTSVFGCATSEFEDPIYLIQAACFPKSQLGIALNCPSSCEKAIMCANQSNAIVLLNITHMIITDPARRLPGLDLLRAFAVTWVLIFHYSIQSPNAPFRAIGEFGWMGVDLFFGLYRVPCG
jgi:hypothetical protein